MLSKREWSVNVKKETESLPHTPNFLIPKLLHPDGKLLIF